LKGSATRVARSVARSVRPDMFTGVAGSGRVALRWRGAFRAEGRGPSLPPQLYYGEAGQAREAGEAGEAGEGRATTRARFFLWRFFRH
jgi:hypothetical protein